MIKQKNLILILLLPILLTGCLGINLGGSKSSSSSAKKNAVLGGMFRSGNSGETWERVSTIYRIGKEELNFNAANITTMSFDPLDDKAIYVGTQNDGVFYTFNYGEGWYNTLKGLGTINDILVNPSSNCVIYAAVHNSIYKSVDCSRNWKRIYFETRSGQYITALAINGSNTDVVYAGTSGGSFLKSKDAGNSWDVIRRFNDYISDIFIQNQISDKMIYVASQKYGILKSEDGGDTWTDLMELKVDQTEINEEKLFVDSVEARKKELKVKDLTPEEYAKLEAKKYKALKSIGDTKKIYSISIDYSVKDGLIYANPVGIFRLTDNKMWKQLSLLTPPSKDRIYSVTVNAKNTKEIVYGTSSAWYRTIDNGENWVIKPLPTDHSARIMQFSPDQKYLYLGTYKVKK